MKGAGYSTGYFGKWHLGDTAFLPHLQGYNVSNEGWGHYNVEFRPPRAEGSKKRASELLSDFGEEFIEQNKTKPFFLFLSYYDVHAPLDADMDIIEKYLKKERKDYYPSNAIYAAMIEHLDKAVGRIVDKIRECGLENNTMVIFTSDNGGEVTRGSIARSGQKYMKGSSEVYEDSPMRYTMTSNSPFRGEKGTVYEEGIRTPLIVKWPGKIKPGILSDAIASSVDFYPTFLEVAGAERPKGQVLDGKSILPELTENKYDYERAIFWHFPVYHHDVPKGAVRKGDWKLVLDFATGKPALYNLRGDISEVKDLSTRYPEKTEELLSLLRNWQKDVGAEIPVPNPNFDEARRHEQQGTYGSYPQK